MNKDLEVREVSLEILKKVLYENEQGHRLIKAVLDKNNDWESARKAFLKKLTLGVLERKEELEYVLSLFYQKNAKRMKPVIRLILLQGAYQILYMEQVYDSKACNLAVELAGKKGFSALGGFVNGVLRSLSRGKDTITYPSPQEDPAAYLRTRYSVPEWMGKLLITQYGFENAERIGRYSLTEPKLHIRFKESVSKEEKKELLSAFTNMGVKCEECSFLPGAYALEHTKEFTMLPGFAEGKFYVQDFSAQLAGYLLPLKGDETVYDICAAPGGKSLYAADKLTQGGVVYACDLTGSKVSRIRENVERMGYENIRCGIRDAREPFDQGKADVIIADVPCSGLGVIARKPDLKYRLKEEDLMSIEALQKEILTAAVSGLKEGGLLMYSTCTVNRAENEETLQWMLKHLPLKEKAFTDVPKELKEDLLSGGVLRILPGEHASDGFYIALLEKTAPEQE